LTDRLSPRLRHEIHGCEAVVLLRVVRLVADAARASATFEVGQTTGGLTTDVGRTLRAQLGVVIVPLTVLARQQRSHRDGVDHLAGSPRVSPAFELLGDAFCALVPRGGLTRWAAI